MSLRREPSKRRPQAKQVVASRRDTHAAADIRSDTQRRAAHGDQRPFTAGRATGGEFAVERRGRVAVDVVVGLGSHQTR